MALDSEFERDSEAHTKIRATWGGHRRKRSMRTAESLSIAHYEIDAINHDSLRKMAEAEEICVGEFLDVLIDREVKRRIAKGATGLRTALFPSHV